MCKVLMITGINKDNAPKVESFVKDMSIKMSVANRDGLGYAAIDNNGKLFGERWLQNEKAWTKPEVTNDLVKVLFGMAVADKDDPDAIDYNSFGKVKSFEDMRAIIVHTRMATSPKGLMNTHPMVDGSTALIHNGVIRNEYEYKDEMKTTCDSECLLIEYLSNNTIKNPEEIKELGRQIRGYYAVGALSENNGAPILDIFKSNGAKLVTTVFDELGLFVFTTDRSDLQQAAKTLNIKRSTIYNIKDDMLLRFDLKANKLVDNVAYTSSAEYTGSYQYGSYNNYGGNSHHRTYTPPAAPPSTPNLPSNVSSFTEKYKSTPGSLKELNEREIQENILLSKIK